jgi:hypothetical protein
MLPQSTVAVLGKEARMTGMKTEPRPARPQVSMMWQRLWLWIRHKRVLSHALFIALMVAILLALGAELQQVYHGPGSANVDHPPDAGTALVHHGD